MTKFNYATLGSMSSGFEDCGTFPVFTGMDKSGELRPSSPRYWIVATGYPEGSAVVLGSDPSEGAVVKGHSINKGDWVRIDDYFALVQSRSGKSFSIELQVPGGERVQRIISPGIFPVIEGDPNLYGTLSSSIEGSYYRWKADGEIVSSEPSIVVTSDSGLVGKIIELLVDGVPAPTVEISSTSVSSSSSSSSSSHPSGYIERTGVVNKVIGKYGGIELSDASGVVNKVSGKYGGIDTLSETSGVVNTVTGSYI